MNTNISTLRKVWNLFKPQGEFSIEANLYLQGKHCFFTLHKDILEILTKRGGKVKVYMTESEILRLIKRQLPGITQISREGDELVGYMEILDTQVLKIKDQTLYKHREGVYIANPKLVGEKDVKEVKYYIEMQK